MIKYDSNKVNSYIADVIHKYISDGYRIDNDNCVIDKNKDNGCLFKAVLCKNCNGLICHVKITLSESSISDNVKKYTYHKIDSTGSLNFGEEIKTYIEMVIDDNEKNKLDDEVDYKDKSNDEECTDKEDVNDCDELEDDQCDENDDQDDNEKDDLDDKLLDDSLCNTINNICSESESFESCSDKLSSLFNKMYNYAIDLYCDDLDGKAYKSNSCEDKQNCNVPNNNHIKIDTKDTEKDIYDKITAKYKNTNSYDQSNKEVNKVNPTTNNKENKNSKFTFYSIDKDTNKFVKQDDSLNDYLNNILYLMFGK